MAPKATRKPATKPKAAAPRPWPPKVPLGPIEDVLPLIADDDESVDTLMVPSPGLLGDGAQGADFGPEEIHYVCQCLQKNTSVTQLNVSMSPIGDVGAAHIAALLEPGRQLMRLSLNSCDIGSDGAQALAEGLARCDVMVVELTNNRIDDAGCQALLGAVQQNTRLKEVQLSFNHISRELEAEMEKALRLR